MIFAGSQAFSVRQGPQAAPLTALLHYPCAQPSCPTRFGPYQLDVSVDAPPAPGRFPLVLISHGSGGSPLGYRTLSLLLARSGYFVALPRHPGDSVGDDALAHSLDNLHNRPAHLIALLDALLNDPVLGACIADEPVSAIGHSMGGYTVLSVAGGQPFRREREPLMVAHDARIGAVVLLAPACGPFLAPKALGRVTAPLLALTAQHDYLTPDREVRAALAGITDQTRVTIRMVPGAGHFSFLSPFPRAMHSPQFEPAGDPLGFDRERFHEWFPDLIREWIGDRRGERRALGGGRG